ncbi:DNA repair exonuclease [Sporosarcina sp. 179-K 3D1 HS]|uniref:metallophosphoesterase family protein n=1 Tax=Sporosarcina sp. 179-K 3D1 HS TaxID=3232169 RepID=UPI0039A13125
MPDIRFIHTADLHLDSPFKGLAGLSAEHLQTVRESTFSAYQNLVKHAVETKPDFLLIVGDVYDGEDRSLRAQVKFQEGLSKLEAAGIPVFICHGNHDHLDGKWTRFELPSNVYVFDEEVSAVPLRIKGQDIIIHGFSYKERHVREPVINRYPVAENRDALHIGMLHGSVAGDETHAVYAPFTKEALLSKQYDYWALGHIHLRQQLHHHPPIVYPGNLQGRHRKESGLKGFYEVTLSKAESTITFVPASALVFDRLEVSCAGMRHANEWFAACQEAIETFQAKFGPCLLELKMIDLDADSMSLFQEDSEEAWLDALREMLEDSEIFVWVQQLTFEWKKEQPLHNRNLVQSVQDMMDRWTEEEWKLLLKDVYQHRGSRYLDVLTPENIQDIKAGAGSLLGKEMTEAD